jgi:hypothetical protein
MLAEKQQNNTAAGVQQKINDSGETAGKNSNWGIADNS